MTTSELGRPQLWYGRLVLLGIFVLAFGLRWYYVSTALVQNPVRGDAVQYYAYAHNLATYGVFSKDLPGAAAIHPDNYRDPGYPVFLAFWMKILGTDDAWYAAVLLSQAFVGALTVVLATQLGRHWLSLRWAAAAGVLMAVWPHSITVNDYLLSETLFSFLVVLGMLAGASALRRPSPPRAALAGVILGAAALTNAILLPFGVLLGALLAWRKLASRTVCFALILGALALPAAWALRNAGMVAPSDTSSSMNRALQNLVQGSWPSFQSDWRDSVLGDASTQARARLGLHAVDAEIGLIQTSPVRGLQSLAARIGQHPSQLFRWYMFDKPVLLWSWNIQIGQGDIYIFPTQNAPFQTQRPWIALEATCRALNTLLMLLALASLLCLLPRSRALMAWKQSESAVVVAAVIGLLAFVTLVYSTLQSEPRYSIPFRPFEILLSISALCAGARRWRRR